MPSTSALHASHVSLARRLCIPKLDIMTKRKTPHITKDITQGEIKIMLMIYAGPSGEMGINNDDDSIS